MSAKYTFLAWEIELTNPLLKIALLQLANNSNDDGISWYAIEKMAKRAGMSESSFRRKTQELESMGLLKIIRRQNKTSVYKLLLSLQQVGVNAGPVDNSNGGCQSDRSGGVSVTPDLKRDPNNKKINKKESKNPVDNSKKEESKLDTKDPNFRTRYETEEPRTAEVHNTRNISHTNFENPSPRKKCSAVIEAELRTKEFKEKRDPKIEQEYLAELKRLSGLASDKKNE